MTADSTDDLAVGHAMAQRMLAELPRLKADITARRMAEQPVYRRLPAEQLRHDVRRVTEQTIRGVARSLQTGQPLEPRWRAFQRAWAALHARAAEGCSWRLDNLREMLQRDSVDPADWPVEPVDGDFANDWLMIPNEDGTGTVLGILADPDGSNTTECLDTEGNTVGVLLILE
ncbi:hypothetical protein ACIRVF_06085 [Kitasatospora sp. NPDC101157]|uniref:hypothetical protein n=1 Tax=Kitasatospora sp. NPDC101157 TaxID=3364098 RepID=UPI0038049E98